MTAVPVAAMDYLTRGWGVVPLYGVDGDQCRCRAGRMCPPKNKGKHPSTGNQWQKKALTSGPDVAAWYEDHPDDNVGILTGPASGIFVFDVDGAAGVRSVSDFATEHGALPSTRIVRTGSGGLHYFYRHPGHFTVHGSAGWIAPGIDIRGIGGQVVAPPSVSGRGAYEVLADHPIAEAPAWLLTLLAEHARHYEAGRSVEAKSAERVDVEFLPPRIRDLASTLVAEDAGRYRHFHAIVAACYEDGYSQGQTVTIVAPWCVAVDKFVGRVESEVARCWGKLQAEAAKANEWLPGVAGPRPSPPPGPDQPDPTEPDPAAPADDSPDQTVPDPTPSWRPVDLDPILTGTYVPETPDLYPRSDGPCLVYTGRIHSFHGESESGKSLIVQAETARLLKTGHHVLYIDFESDAAAVVGRLLDLGCTVDQVRSHFTYLRPDNDPRKFAYERAEYAALLARSYTLVVIDGMTDALGAFGAGTKDNDEIASFMRSFPRLIAARTGAAVIVIDHVTKDADSRGRFALGGQAKMNALDGSAFTVEVTEALGRGMRGVVTLRVAKDRPGGVRPHSGPFRSLDRTQVAARVIVDSTGDGIEVTVEPPPAAGETSAKAGPFRPTNKMQEISEFLDRATSPVSQDTVVKGVGGTEKTVTTALSILVAEGFVNLEIGSRKAKLHTLAKRYFADEDKLSDTWFGWVDQGHNGPTSATSADLRSTSAKNGVSDLREPPPPLRGVAEVNGGQETATSATTSATFVDVGCVTCHRPTPRATATTFGGRCAACAEKAGLL